MPLLLSLPANALEPGIRPLEDLDDLENRTATGAVHGAGFRQPNASASSVLAGSAGAVAGCAGDARAVTAALRAEFGASLLPSSDVIYINFV